MGVKTWKEEFALVGKNPTFVYVPGKVQVTQLPSRSHWCSPALTAPNNLISSLSKVGASTRLESCTSLHHLPRCLSERSSFSWVSCQPPGCEDCLCVKLWLERGRTGVFSSPHPSIPSPNKHQEKWLLVVFQRLHDPVKYASFFSENEPFFFSYVFIWCPEVPGFPGIYMKNSSYSSHHFHTHSSCQQTLAIWGLRRGWGELGAPA